MHPLRHANRVVDPLDVLEEDGKLIPSETGNRVLGSDTTPQPLGHRFQEPVARRVAKAVVDVLEAIQVDKEGSEGLALAPSSLEHVAEAVQEEPAIGQAGEGVVEDDVMKALFQFPLLGDIEGHPHGPGDGAATVPQGLHVRLEGPTPPLEVVVNGFAQQGSLVGLKG
jgi:hypothetical protein